MRYYYEIFLNEFNYLHIILIILEFLVCFREEKIFFIRHSLGGFNWIVSFLSNAYRTSHQAKCTRRNPIKISDILIINSSWNHFWLRFHETLNLIRKNGRRKENLYFHLFVSFRFIWLNIFRLTFVWERELVWWVKRVKRGSAIRWLSHLAVCVFLTVCVFRLVIKKFSYYSSYLDA